MRHLTPDELDAGLDEIRQAPADDGELVLIVGDNWLARGSRQTQDGSASPDKQITVMNIRATDLVAVTRDRVPLAGDQLYVDLDLSIDNLPTGSQLHIGDAVLEVSEAPHLGCEKFVARFGADAMRFVNGRVGRSLRLRGLNARVVTPGSVRVGDRVRVTRHAPDITSAMVASKSSST